MKIYWLLDWEYRGLWQISAIHGGGDYEKIKFLVIPTRPLGCPKLFSDAGCKLTNWAPVSHKYLRQIKTESEMF